MMARKPVGDKLDVVKVTCDVCVAVGSTPHYHLGPARAYLAAKWGWAVTPSSHDLCHVCVARGEHLRPPYSVCPPTPPSLAIPANAIPKPKAKPAPKPRAKAKK